mmetsp:Transcript_11897/g.17170  ORF Transcript_11897/g.17170 Transcript_11897/m.17170 type:complete len:828 (+) Transcript_11897:61-2544(+)
MTPLQQRVRDSGVVTPLLLHDSIPEPEDGFEDKVIQILGSGNHGLSLDPGSFSLDDFDSVLQMAEYENINALEPDMAKKVAERRRSIILAIVALTSPESPLLKKLLSGGFLIKMNSWLIDDMKMKIGGIDLLLLSLSSLKRLPVSKELIAVSKIGKTIAQLEKAFPDSPNRSAIMENIATLKEEWTTYVKTHKTTEKSDTSPSSVKRPRDSASSSPEDAAAPKKLIKSKVMSTSDLLRKSGANADESKQQTDEMSLSAAEMARRKAKERQEKERERLSKSNQTKHEIESINLDKEGPKLKRAELKVSFAEKPTVLNADEYSEEDSHKPKGHGDEWSTLKKKEHMLEKELLLNARKQHLEERHVKLDSMKPSVPWKIPEPITPISSSVFVESSEASAQLTRIGLVRPMLFLSDEDVPVDPTPLSSVQHSLDMVTQDLTKPAIIPFFAPKQESIVNKIQETPLPASSGLVVANTAYDESAKLVQAMGLPLFLTGYNIQALQTLASTPGLLQTFVNAQGHYDEQRLKTLVEALSQSLTPNSQTALTPTTQPAPAAYTQPPALFQNQQLPQQLYSLPPQTVTPSTFAPYSASSRFPEAPKPMVQQVVKGVYRGDQNSVEGSNLHVSGYGPSATKEDIVALFTPYVTVTELVPKGTFCFVNTNDPDGARRAREALSGILVGGLPIRINVATRKERDPNKGKSLRPAQIPQPSVVPYGQVDYENVRDDRGNYSTKNLFVAGYGTGTTENDIRSIFGQFGNVTGTVMKGTFCFVNTIDKETAVKARNGLTGVMLNGGPLRINFAKESGRLGTSFDQTYNSNTYGSGAHSQRVFM